MWCVRKSLRNSAVTTWVVNMLLFIVATWKEQSMSMRSSLTADVAQILQLRGMVDNAGVLRFGAENSTDLSTFLDRSKEEVVQLVARLAPMIFASS